MNLVDVVGGVAVHDRHGAGQTLRRRRVHVHVVPPAIQTVHLFAAAGVVGGGGGRRVNMVSTDDTCDDVVRMGNVFLTINH